MDARFTLPPELVAGASISGNEYGWQPDLFPNAANRAATLGYACLGGQFQFRARVGVCEMYWLSADATDRQQGEEWRVYCERSRTEVLDKFQQIMSGNQYDVVTGRLLSSGGFGSLFDQLFGFGFPGYGGQLSLTLPFRDRGAQAQLGNALVSKQRDLYSARQMREMITRQARDAADQLEAAEVALDAANKSVEFAKKQLAAEQRKYELGAETNFYLLDARSRLAQAELSLLQARIAYQMARASVEHAKGSLLVPFRLQFESLSK